MATPVTCRWTGAVKEKATREFGQGQWAKELKNAKKSEMGTNQPTNGWTDRRTDG